MLHPLLVNLIETEVAGEIPTPKELESILEKTSARLFSYERDIKMLEHTSRIANEDYEAINARLKDVNSVLGRELSEKLHELELLSQFPIINPNPIIRTSAEGKIEFANKAALKFEKILYANKTYTFEAFFKEIISQIGDSGKFEIQMDESHFLFHYQRFQNSSLINFYGTNITDQINTRKRAYENFYRLSNFLESTDAVHYIIYKNQKENNFFTSRWPLIFGFNPSKSEDPLGEKVKCVTTHSSLMYENYIEQLESTGNAKVKYQVQNRLTGKLFWLEEEARKKFDPFLNDEVITGKITDITDKELLKANIEETESRFRQITEAMPVMIWVSNEFNRVVYSNQKTRAFFGKGLEEFDGPEEFIRFVHPEAKAMTGNEWLNNLVQHKEVEQEYLIRNAEGKYHYILEKAIPRFLPTGEFLGYIGAFFDLTKEYEYAQELSNDKKQLELIASNSNDIVLLTDLNGIITYTSPAVKRITGFEVAEVMGRSIYDFFCPSCSREVAPAIRKNDFLLNSSYKYTFRIVTKEGEEIWTESVVSAIQNTSKELSLIWHIRDINEQQIAFNQLKQSEEVNRLIMNSAMDAIICMDIEGNLNFWSKQAENIFGWQAEEVLSRPMAEIIMPDDYKHKHDKGFLKYKASGKPKILNQLLEVPAKHKNGRVFPAEIFIIHVKTETQNFFCSFIRDVSERKQALAAIVESERRYKSIFENMALGVMEVNTKEEIVYANDAMQRISGYTLDELLGKNARDLFISEDKESKNIHTEQMQLRKKQVSSVYDINVKAKDGRRANWIISGAPLIDVQGNLKGSVGIHWDVTKIKEMESELLNEKLTKEKAIFEASLLAEEEQRSVIGRDLHDGVGQMLAYISLYINMIKAKGSYGTEELEGLQKSVVQTLEQVRTLSRNLTPPSIRDLGLRDAVIELIQSYKILKKPLFKLSVYRQPVEDLINLDKKIVLYRVLQELISNSFKYADANNISIHLLEEDGIIYLRYQDDGKGFDPEKVKKGVGLNSISARVDFHKGAVSVKSKPGAGTFITVQIPIINAN